MRDAIRHLLAIFSDPSRKRAAGDGLDFGWFQEGKGIVYITSWSAKRCSQSLCQREKSDGMKIPGRLA